MKSPHFTGRLNHIPNVSKTKWKSMEESSFSINPLPTKINNTHQSAMIFNVENNEAISHTTTSTTSPHLSPACSLINSHQEDIIEKDEILPETNSNL
jgi:hypothetical protein